MLAHGHTDGYTAKPMTTLAELLGIAASVATEPLGDLRGAFAKIDLARWAAPDETEEEDDDETTEDGDDATDENADKGKKEEIKDPAAKDRAEREKRYRLAAKAEKTRADAAEKALKDITEKDKPEVDRLKAENDDLSKKVAKMEAVVKKSAVQGAFGLKHSNKFQDAEDALALLLSRNEFEVDEDTGEIDGLQEAVEALLKQKPYLAASGGKDDEDNNESSAPSGRTTNGHKKGKKELDAAALAAKFPALRR